MAKYITFMVAVPIEQDGDLAKRLEKEDERTGMSVQQLVETTVQLGLYGQITRNLALIEDSPAMKNRRRR